MKILRLFVMAAAFLIMVAISINLVNMAGKDVANTGIYVDLAAMGVLMIGLVFSHFQKKDNK